MSEVRTAPVKAQRFEDIDDVAKVAGAFEYYRSGDRFPAAGIIYNCPCGCGHQGVLHFRPDPSPSWEWGWKPRRADADAFGSPRRPLARLAQERRVGELLMTGCSLFALIPFVMLIVGGIIEWRRTR